MNVYNNLIKSHDKEVTKLKSKLDEKTLECDKLKKELAELKKQTILSPQVEVNTNRNAGTDYNKDSQFQNLIEKNQLLEKKVSQLEALLNENKNQENKTNSDSQILLSIPCPEKPLFKNEIQDYLYTTLYSALENDMKNFPENKDDEHFRKQDVLSSILSARVFKLEETETLKLFSKITSGLYNHKKYDYGNIETYGFIKKGRCNNHIKYYFHSERYQLTFSLTPSDGNASKQQIREIKKRCFLLPELREKNKKKLKTC